MTESELGRWKTRALEEINRKHEEHTTHLTEILQKFQNDLIASQMRLQLAWNAMNTFLKVLLDKGLALPKDVEDASVELMRQAKENHVISIEKWKRKQPVTTDDLKKTPMDDFKDTLQRISSKEENSDEAG